MIRKTYKVIGMHCTSCPLIIESDLEDAGIKAHCSYAKQILDVEFDEQMIQDSKIKEVVKSAGYDIVG